MIKRLQARKGEEAGFTLVELLVVIAILGILAAVVVFAVGGITDKGQGSACEIDARTIRTAQEAHFAKTGRYANETGNGTTPPPPYLVPDFLSKQSTLYDTAATGTNGADYTITIQDTTKCGSTPP